MLIVLCLERTPCVYPARHRRTGVHSWTTLESRRNYFATSRYRQEDVQALRSLEELGGSVPITKVVWGKAAVPGHIKGKEVENKDHSLEGELPPDYTLDQVGPTALRDTVRGLMRHVPSSVAIITAAHLESNKRVPLGIAVSSFNTVTLDPPHISFNIKCPSQTLDAIRNAKGLFRIHLLSGTVESSRVVDTFSKGNTEEAYMLRKHTVPIFLPQSRNVADATESAAPQIRGNSVVAALECELTQELPVADHIIAVAKVNSMATLPELEATLLYHDGAYKKTDGTVLNKHMTSSTPQLKLHPDVGVYWRYPLFPGTAERDEFVNFLKLFLHRNPHFLQMAPHTTKIELAKTLGLPSGVFGISLSPLIEQCRVEAGHPPSLSESFQNAPLLAEFYGRLGPRDIASIVERARKLVFADPMALALQYRDFFSHLGLSTASYGLLASDIIERLRLEGLVAPFELQASRVSDYDAHLTIESLEDVEVRLRNFMKTSTYQDVYNMTSGQLKRAVEGSDAVEEWIRAVRDRLTVEAFPEVFNATHIDIKGELTPEEVRVFVNRVIQFLNINDRHTMKRHMALPRIELLRRVGVHPLISGIDPNFLFGKLAFLVFQSTREGEIREAVSEMLKPIFEKRVFPWAELTSRVKAFVQSHTFHVVKWSREDILAAMGIDHRAKIKTPLSENRPHILHGHMLPTLIAKELKAYYGHGTPAENTAIKSFLKTQYNYDVVASTPSSSAALTEDPSVSSADEMHEAMLKGLNVHVRKEDRQKMELQEAFLSFGKKDGGRKVAGLGVDGKAVGVPGWGRKGKERRRVMEMEGWNKGAVGRGRRE